MHNSAISFFEVLVYKTRTESCYNITFLYYFFACLILQIIIISIYQMLK